ncbi:MAG TPA: UDP-2,3-diacylglucosamine diphosphatase LpxI [Alphaproteobacteria bacterium]|nr:UDP-2,3-diacylglucosamine diphosphatase LpxI [Alphaproteobacteria bacterium]
MSKRLGLLAGGGTLPAVLASGARAQGFEVHLITFEAQPQPQLDGEKIASHAKVGLGAIGKTLAQLKAKRVTHVAMAGNLNRPSLFTLKLDTHGLRLLPRLRSFSDDALLKVCTGYLAEKGFTILGVADLAPQLLAPAKLLTRLKPNSADKADIALAIAALEDLGKHDIGQAAIVHHGSILGIEGVEGTDALIERCAPLRGKLANNQRAGVLVKMAKPGQTDLADLPTVGPHTLKLLGQLGYRGVAVQAGKTILLGGDAFAPAADKAGLFVTGI